MLSYYVIYYKKFRKVMRRTEKEALNNPLALTKIVGDETYVCFLFLFFKLMLFEVTSPPHFDYYIELYDIIVINIALRVY